MMTLHVSYENVKFAASDVIRETLCQRLLLVEYFELKITDNQSDDFLRMLTKNDHRHAHCTKLFFLFKNSFP